MSIGLSLGLLYGFIFDDVWVGLATTVVIGVVVFAVGTALDGAQKKKR